MGVAVLGGDVYAVKNDIIESNYDNWYCNLDAAESDSDFVGRSITVAWNYITNYHASEGVVLFAIVPKI